MNTPPAGVLRSGLSAPPQWEQLEAGPLRVLFEPASGALRAIRLGGIEVLRGINAPVRDRNWDTVPAVVSGVKIERGQARFQVEFDVDCRQAEIDFGWHGSITGAADGTLRFTFAGRARSRFLKNRIGFCVLHPSEICAGAPCRVRNTAGSVSEGVFPALVSPHQPFLGMSMIEHRVAGNLWARVEMSGEVFEMEDQRNWGDASFKTYCTPLANPFPVEMAPGDEVRQEVVVTLVGERPAVPAPRAAGAVEVEPAAARQPLPALGLGFDPEAAAMAETHWPRLRSLKLAHLRVDVMPSRGDAAARLKSAASAAAAAGTRLEAALLLTADYRREIEQILAMLDGADIRAARWLLLPASEPASAAGYAQAAQGLGAARGGGTNAFFAELNRNRPPEGVFDEICWSFNPQVHAFDNRSLAETLLALGAMVRTARSFSGNAPLVVSPVTLKMRFHPNATVEAIRAPLGHRESRVDSRQMSLFNAAWTLGCIAAHAEAGVNSLTLFETHGPCGVLGPNGTPDWFPVRDPALVYPVYHVLAALAPFAGARTRGVNASEALTVAGLWTESEGKQGLHLANLTAAPVRVRLPRGGGLRRTLDERNAWAAMTEPGSLASGDAGPGREIELAPYAIEWRVWDNTGTR